MIKKIFLPLFLLVFVTGCDVTYNLTIEQENFTEEINFSLSKDLTSYDEVLAYYSSNIPVSFNSLTENKFYKSFLDSDSYNYYLKYHYNHDLNTLENSYFINNCYNDFEIKQDDVQLIISTGEQFNCIYGDDGANVDNVVVNIKTDLKVISSNADEVSGNIYSWKVDKTNYLNKPINIVIEKVSQDSNFWINFLIFGFIFIIIVAVLLRLRFKNKNSNIIN